MKTSKSRMLPALGAVAVSLCLAGSAAASFSKPNYKDDLRPALLDVTTVIDDITALTVIQGNNIKLVEIGDLNLSNNEVVSLEDLIDLQTGDILTFRESLLDLDLDLLNGLTFEDFLNDNDVDISEVVAVKVYKALLPWNNKLILFTCPCGAEPYGSPCG